MKSGFVSIIGRPNAGKSTLLNAFVKQKISIVSWRPHPTRNKITGILTDKEKGFQLVFLDTPGIHTPKNALGVYMQKVVKQSLDDIDVILYVHDSGRELTTKDIELLTETAKRNKTIVVLNKTDEVTDDKVMSLIEKLKDVNALSIVPASAKNRVNLDIIIDEILKVIDEGVQYYPDDMVTDRTMRFLVTEIVREKALKNLSQEVPHGIGVEVTSYSERKQSGIVDISVDIICEKQTHKAIIIGKNGSMLKKILTDARLDMERLLESKVFLKGYVKVKEDWRDNTSLLSELGYNKSEI